MNEMAKSIPRLGPGILQSLPASVDRPHYDRSALRRGMAHIGVGAFHRAHQAEYTDDLLAKSFDRWGIVGVNIRPPGLTESLGAQSGLYTRLLRDGARNEARIIGSIVEVVESIENSGPALEVLASPDIDVVTLTVTEKGYCHRPADGSLDTTNLEVAADIATPEAPRTVPGILARALEMRMMAHGKPLTIVSCDNIPENGVILGNVVREMARLRCAALSDWVEGNAAFPSCMVDRIAPATTPFDTETVERSFGYRDSAVVVGEPFRQWVIEQKFAGRFPRWDAVGAAFVDDVTPYEHIKMRVLNGAQTTLANLGVLAGHEYTFDAIGDPLLEAFVRRMLVEETVTTLAEVPGMPALLYVDQSLARLHNTAIRHRCHQIATDGSQKIVQRLLNPVRERARRGQASPMLGLSVAAWMAYLILASSRFGSRWKADDPLAGRIAAIADATGDNPTALVGEILRIESIFGSELASLPSFADSIASPLSHLLSSDPMSAVKRVMEN